MKNEPVVPHFCIREYKFLLEKMAQNKLFPSGKNLYSFLSWQRVDSFWRNFFLENWEQFFRCIKISKRLFASTNFLFAYAKCIKHENGRMFFYTFAPIPKTNAL
jgi:hypothetical protein